MADAAQRRRARPLAGNARARENELTRTFSPPLHYAVEIKPVSELLKLEEYEFGVFEAGGYRWSLTLYTRSYEGRDGKKYMSLRLSIEKPDKLRDSEEVFVKCRFFVFDYNRKDYVIFEEKGKELRAYSKANQGRESIKLLSLKSFQDPKCQYRERKDDRCKFGAEVLVKRRERKKETVTFIRERPPDKITTKIQQFSSSKESPQSSDSFQFEGRKWKLKVCPQSTDGGRKRKMLSVYLKAESISEGKKIYVKAKLRMLNRHTSDNKEKTVSGWVSAEDNYCRRKDFMEWSDLEKPNGGFVRGNALRFEVEFLVISRVERKDERLR